VIDAAGKYVMPGLVDAHCHIGMAEDAVGAEGDDVNEMTDPSTPHLRAIDAVFQADRAFEEARENGVTSVVTGPGSANVLGGQFIALKTYGRRVEEMVIKENVAVKAAFGENPKNCYGGEKKSQPMTRMATAAILRENLFKAREYMQDKIDHESNKEENDKPDFDMKMESLIPVLRGEIPLKAHAHRSDDILTSIRIAKEFGVKITLDHCTEGYLIKDILLEEGLPAIVGPMLVDRCKIEMRNMSLKNPGELSNAGIKVAIMTDAPCTPVQYLILCASIACREGMTEEDAFKAVTINAAEITGIGDRVGSLEIGKDADVVIYDGHPFEIRTRVETTVISGKIVYESKLS
jgi:imidazolonepropionase-like amidohydrolase